MTELIDQLLKQTNLLSFPDQIRRTSAYKEIIGSGQVMVPPLLEALRERPIHSFAIMTALGEITDEQPWLPEHRGDIDKMADCWLAWGQHNDLI